MHAGLGGSRLIENGKSRGLTSILVRIQKDVKFSTGGEEIKEKERKEGGEKERFPSLFKS